MADKTSLRVVADANAKNPTEDKKVSEQPRNGSRSAFIQFSAGYRRGCA